MVFLASKFSTLGGVWERMVKSAKKHLSVLLKKDSLNLGIFEMVIIEVEAILNCRPLTQVSVDIKDYDAITPAHFLYPGVVTHSSVRILPPNPFKGEELRLNFKKVRPG
jgi:hypothetical protein